MYSIKSSNISDFLKYLEPKINKQFSEETISKWQSLSNEDIEKNLAQLFLALGISENEKNNWINEFSKINFPEFKSPDVPKFENPAYTTTETPPAYTYTNPVSTNPSTQNIQTPAEPLKENIKTAPNITTTKKKKSWTWLLITIFFLSLLLASAYIWFKYETYTNRSRVYCLTNNIAIRSNNDDKSQVLGRMDFNEKYLDNNNKIQSSIASLPLVDDQIYDGYYKVYLDTSFFQYLLNNGENTNGYIFNKFVTTDKTEFKKYLQVFKNIEDDYNELDKLQYVYRKAIVVATLTNSDLENKILAVPCYKEKKLISKAPLSIAQMKIKNNSGHYDYFVVTRFNDDQYYTLKSNEDGSLIEVYPTQYKDIDGTKAMTEAGKFKIINKNNFTYGDIEWSNCDNTKFATSSFTPFDIFETEDARNYDINNASDNIINEIQNAANSVIDAVTPDSE